MIFELYKNLRELNISLEVVDHKLDIIAPKGALNQELLDQITANKEELIKWIENYKLPSKNISEISPTDLKEMYPLSPNQERMWIFDQFNEGSAAYNIYGAYVCNGKLELAVLSKAFSSIIERHEILRTNFTEDENGTVCQFIRQIQDVGPGIVLIDLSETNGSEKKSLGLVQEEIETPFDLRNAPLFRIKLIKISQNKHVLIFVMHHIISDGWSLDVLMRELHILYSTYLEEKKDPLDPLRIQYKDFSAWQLQELNGDALKKHMNYWFDQFAGDIPVIDFPLDHKRPLIKAYSGGCVKVKLQEELSKQLRLLQNGDDGYTTFMLLLAAVNVLLYRYTGNTDIVIGCPVVGRDHVDLEDQIGFYSNTLAIRTKLKDSSSFKEILRTIKQTTLGAYEHQIYPFDKLVEQLAVNRDMSRNALFDIMVSFQNNSGSDVELRLGNLVVEELENIKTPVSKFDLTFDFKESGNDLYLLLEYDNVIFRQSTIQTLATHFERILSKVIEQPLTPVGKLDFLSDKEKNELLGKNNTVKDLNIAGGKTVVDLFERQAKENPDSIAVVCGETQVNYYELNILANRLSKYLIAEYKICTEDIIAVKLNRSEWIPIVILAILKSGGAYVPIDPSMPEERIDFIIKDAHCKVVIDDVVLKEFRNVQDVFDTANCIVSLAPENLAYCIYTSGSTGGPKGVLVEHGSLLSRILAETELLSINETVVTCLTTNYVFDVSLLEIFLPLVKGGRLIIPSDEIFFSKDALEDCLVSNKVNILQGTPSFMSAIILEMDTTKDFQIKQLSVGGESLNNNLVVSLKEKWPFVKINNHYGPTECTIDAIVLSDVLEFKNNILGTPVADTFVCILDHMDQLVPLGVYGEICIGGKGLARGYLNQPDLTRKKFIQNPFNKSERLYRTGDIGRRLSDNNFEFLKRNDNQVKIKGYRIELGEIEEVLMSNKNVKAAHVRSFEVSEGEHELLAYVVCDENYDFSDIKVYLSSKLPFFMIPSNVIRIERMPLTINGKVDKKLLPEPGGSIFKASVEYMPPRNSLDEKLVEIFSEVLGIPAERIGIKDNFFELGGHSLKAVMAIHKIEKQLEIKLKITDVFLTPVVESISDLIKAKQWLQQKELESENRNIIEI
jgi:amino acid adenylation domain-containing protein